MLAWSGKSALGLAFYCACLPVLAVLSATSAAAQETTPLRNLAQSPNSPIPERSYFFADENAEILPVRQRGRPNYDALGIRNGSFLFYPGVTVTPFYDSNVFATSANQQSDGGIIFMPGLVVESDWNNHALKFDVGLQHQQYFDLTSESRTDGHAIVSGRVDVRRDLVVLAAVSAAYRHEPRGTSNSPVNAAEPVAYDEFDGALSINKSFNRVDVSLGVAAEYRNYHDAKLLGGGSLDQDYRDGSLFQTGGRIAYVVKPGIRVFADARYNWRQFNNPPGVNADSQGYNLLGGLEFTLTSLIRGEVGVGYMNQSYEGAGNGNASGISYSAKLIWNPTPIMTMTFNGDRSISDTGIAGSPGRVDSSFGVVLDYELRRNVIVSPSIKFRHEDYAGISRSDFVIEPSLNVDYLINRYFSVGLGYSYTNRDSSVSVNDFDRHLVSINAQAKF